MIFKKLMLAGIAASAFAFASQADATSITAQIGAGTAPTLKGADLSVSGPQGGGFTSRAPYLLAQELNYTRGVTAARGQFDTVAALGGALANSGTYSLTITYNGATLNGVSNMADLTFRDGLGNTITGIQVTPNGSTSSGNSGSSTATYTFTTNSTATGTGGTGTAQQPSFIDIAPAIIVKNGGAVTMTVSIVDNTTQAPFSPDATAELIAPAQGFKLVVANNTTPLTYIPSASGYTTLSNNGTIGFVSLQANMLTGATNPNVYQDLAGTIISPTAAISTENITVSGDFSEVNAQGNNGATFGSPSGGSEFTSFAGPQTVSTVSGVIGANETITLVPNGTGGAIPPSSYNATASVILNNTTFGGSTISSTTGGALQTVNRQGYTVIVPWVASATQAAASGAATTIRVSSINSSAAAGAGGDVYAELINGSAGTRTGIAFMGRLASGGEVVVTSQLLENAFGNFTRGDIRITVDTAGGNGQNGQPNGLIVKRLTVGALGVTEMLNLNEQGTLMDLNTATPSMVPPSH